MGTEVKREWEESYSHQISLDAIKKILEPTGECPICNKKVYGSKYCCQKHASMGNRKVAHRPSKKELPKIRP